MVAVNIDMGTVNALIQLLKIPLLILGTIILFRANRILTSAEYSIESIEKTAENVESSSRTLEGFLDIFRREKRGERE